MSKHCKNCGELLTGKYCSSCGQAASTDRINSTYLAEQIQNSVFHMDGGLLLTLKRLCTKPGYFIKKYLEGERVSYFKPFGLLLLLSVVYSFLSLTFKITPEYSDMGVNASSTTVWVEWMYRYFGYITLFTVPIQSLFTFLFFRKEKYNYIEHLVVNAYAFCLQILVNTLLLAYNYFYPTLLGYTITSFIGLFVVVWTYVQLFKRGSVIARILKSILVNILSYLLTFILMMVVVVIVVLLNPSWLEMLMGG